MAPRHSVSVAAAIPGPQGRLLAIKRADNGLWEPPGGVLELGETIEAGVAREVLEETGLTVRPDRLTGIYENLPRGIIALVLRCALVDGTPRVTDETVDVAWLTPGEIRERMAPAYACRLIDALPADGAIPLRPHDGHNLLEPVPPLSR